MVTFLLRLLRLLPLLCGAHRHVALENLALRHQRHAPDAASVGFSDSSSVSSLPLTFSRI